MPETPPNLIVISQYGRPQPVGGVSLNDGEDDISSHQLPGSMFSVLPVDDVAFVYADADNVGVIVSDAPSKTTVTVNVPVLTFPAASVAVQVTVVVPTVNKELLAGEQLTAPLAGGPPPYMTPP